MEFQVRKAGPLEAFEIAAAIPEFGNDAYNLEEYQKRLKPPCLVLIGYHKDQAIAFKAGYQRGPEGSFYSWMGGVLPDYRRKGVALKLAEYQESWARDQGFTRIWFKTRNRNIAMLQFALAQGFLIKEVIPKSKIIDYRIILEKEL